MFKKIILALSIIATSVSAWAAPTSWMDCNTPGDALESASIAVESANGDDLITLTITKSDNSSQTFTASTQSGSRDSMTRAGKVELILKSKKTVEFGGAISDAAYMNLEKDPATGSFEGYLAANSTVYTIRCE